MPDVAGIEAEFDYLIPDALDDRVRVGTIVRVVLQGRHIRGWVINDNATPPDGVTLRPIEKVTGAGPNRELIDLAEWAAWRWAGKRSFFLQTASPLKAVPVDTIPSDEPATATIAAERALLEVVRVPPAGSALDTILVATAAGPTLILTPSHRAAQLLVDRLRKEGRPVALYPDEWAMAARGNCSVVGTRSGAWAPMPEVAAFIVLDAHDESFQSERSPTWNAVDVVVERARRTGRPCLLVSPVPRLHDLAQAKAPTVDRPEERSGWAPVHVVDLRRTDPRTGLFSPALVEQLRSDRRVVCVLNRKGRARLLVCGSCDEIARCSTCAGPVALDDDLVCAHCNAHRPVLCEHCGSSTFKQLRPGTARVREDLESLALRRVGEVTGEAKTVPDDEVLVGTEAVLHRIGRADVVAFLDFDQELLAPRFQAAETALALLARAARLVGGRRRNGLILVQSRQLDHEVIQAAVHGDPTRFSDPELQRRQAMGWPPHSALARVSGKAAAAYVESLNDVELLGPSDGVWLVRAPNHQVLCDALAAVPRPAGNTLRVEVDPSRV